MELIFLSNNIKTVVEKKEKMTSLQALRALSFIGIFLCHARSPFCWPALGVSVFYVISGFLLVYTYLNRDMVISLKGNLKFSLKKIKKLYPLHIITMLCAVILELVMFIQYGTSVQEIFTLIEKIGLNITLLQTWVPKSEINVSLNGVAWFLSVMMFLYFMFPYIHRWIKKKKNAVLFLYCVLILIIQVISCVPLLYFLGNEHTTYIWFMYCFPIFRLGDFFVGCCLGKFYLEKQIGKTSQLKWSIIEILFTGVTAVVMIWPFADVDSLIINAALNWTTPYIPLAAGWVYLFAINKGIVIKLFNNRAFIFLGNISAYTFLIHYVVTYYANFLLDLMCQNLTGVLKACIIVAEFVVTVLVTLVYCKCKSISVNPDRA